MPEREIPITLVTQDLGDDFLVTEPLLFEEVRLCDQFPDRLRGAVRDLARQVAEDSPNFALHRRALAGQATLELVHVTLDPPKKQPDWAEPVQLQFHVIRWRHHADAWLAFVPALGIEVVAPREPDLPRMLPDHILAALRRDKAAQSLYELAITQRTRQVTLQGMSLSAAIKTARQVEQDSSKEKTPRPVIEEIGLVLDDQTLAPAYAIDALIEQMSDALIGSNPKSILLIGPSGVGKTAAIHEMVRRRRNLKKPGDPTFWATSGSRLIAGMSGFGMWQKRCQRLCAEASRDNAIVHLGNLVELMEVGRGGAGRQGIAGFLRPYLARGEILAMAECTPEQFPLIERENPHLLAVFHPIRVEEPSTEAGLEILRNVARALGVRTHHPTPRTGSRRLTACIGAMRRHRPIPAGRCGFSPIY